jgi:hypothetical protein
VSDRTPPQPLGAFGLPAGLLLVPDVPGVEEAREALVAGRVPSSWPESMALHRLVHEDRIDEALALTGGDDPVATYHRWLLDPASEAPDVVRSVLPAHLAPLVDVVLHSLGSGPPPRGRDLGPEVAAEVRALVLAAEATEALGDGRPADAVALMLEAAATADPVAPAAAAVLRGNAGLVAADGGDPGRAVLALESAAAALADTDLSPVRAQLLLRLGSLHQESAAAADDPGPPLQRAVGCYYDGLLLVGEESEPFLWASLTMNLATAHLAVPMRTASDQLRVGIATQSLRASRRVFTPDAYPVQWSTTTLNLANALVYAPSTHREDNLAEAVGLYEEVLRSGVRDADPLGRARLLANQGNALAHLGAFADARARLVEARYVFEEHLDHAAVATVREVLGEIARAEVRDPDDELADLARQAEQMSRMPQPEGAFTAGMGVSVLPAARPGESPPPRPTVTVVDPGTRPTDRPRDPS